MNQQQKKILEEKIKQGLIAYDEPMIQSITKRIATDPPMVQGEPQSRVTRSNQMLNKSMVRKQSKRNKMEVRKRVRKLKMDVKAHRKSQVKRINQYR